MTIGSLGWCWSRIGMSWLSRRYAVSMSPALARMVASWCSEKARQSKSPSPSMDSCSADSAYAIAAPRSPRC